MLQLLDVPKLTQDNIECGRYSFSYTSDLQVTSIVLVLILVLIDRCFRVENVYTKQIKIPSREDQANMDCGHNRAGDHQYHDWNLHELIQQEE